MLQPKQSVREMENRNKLEVATKVLRSYLYDKLTNETQK